MRLFVALSLLSCSACFAEPITVKIPRQEWAVTFDSPAPLQLVEKSGLPGSYFAGSDGRFNISLFVGDPSCPGGTSAYDSYKCLRPKLYKIAGIVESSISLERRRDAIQVSYVVYVPTGDKSIKTMHTHVLFERGGKWGDLHMSAVQPSVAEITRLISLGDGVSLGVQGP